MRYAYLHGFCSSPGSHKAALLRERFQHQGEALYVPDLNQPDFATTSISAQLAWMGAWVDQQDAPVTLIGSSLGGYLAVLLAERHAQVARLWLMAPAFAFVRRHFAQQPQQLREWQAQGWLPLYHYGYEREMRLHWGFYEDALVYEQRPPQRQIETWIIHGLQDEVVPFQVSIDYVQQNRAAELLLVQDDHSLARSIDRVWQQIEQQII